MDGSRVPTTGDHVSWDTSFPFHACTWYWIAGADGVAGGRRRVSDSLSVKFEL